ncbi:MAG: hypothetical protein Q8P98_01200 [Candidatus Rokubacteria bacterium]|nr:hypothetical protein [Candidatus Rokubacteria bacterium]
MILDRSGRRDLARLSLAALLSLVPAAARAAEAPAAPRTSQAKSDEIDAEMLRDLEVLNNPNYARDREIAKRLSFFERMRILNQMTSNRPAREGATTPAEPAKREVR